MDGQNAYNLVALQRAARELRSDARDLANLLADVSAMLESGGASLEASGQLYSARSLAHAYWSLIHAARSLPWIRVEALRLASALPHMLAGETAALPAGHPWQQFSYPSPMRQDEDLFDAWTGT